eukprot:CAMPEP_0176255686 /NCGR_PEP_ID=MMETSP0121_2-20121125/37167_1 /TAXON_ID=160619 /ORGANISM="Kryptoperidinium foliaceum, Strain CCMP 1326" /LENGTH=57 /DNA_ID=CAMNT_0017595517 /DNA_START=12 /DNA_END=182 /DNA_ORIENTATION=-
MTPRRFPERARARVSAAAHLLTKRSVARATRAASAVVRRGVVKPAPVAGAGLQDAPG